MRPLEAFDLQVSRVGDTPRDESDNATHFRSPAAMRWTPTFGLPTMREAVDAEVAAGEVSINQVVS